MPRIFVSYRRSDSGAFTGRIHDHLKVRFGANNVFRDVYNIPAGSDFRTVLHNEVGATDICLVIIGPQWLNVTDAQGKRRLDDPNDFVRIEVEEALKNPKTRVIPVLVDNASMPVAEELPTSMKELAYRNAVKVRTDPDFPHDMEILTRELKRSKIQRVRPGVWALLAFLLILVPGFFLFSAQKGKEPVVPSLTPVVTVRPSETATVVPATPTPLVEPVEPGEIMVLVAQMEQTGTQPRDVTRFIVDDLEQRFGTDLLVTNIRIREYGDVIKTDDKAQEVADQAGAVLIIWGRYDDEAVTVKLQLGSLKSLPDLVLDRATLERVINIRLKIKDEGRETLAYPITGALGALRIAENDFVGTMRLIVSLDRLETQQPEVIDSSVAVHFYKAMLVFLSDRETASNELTQAIYMYPDPFFYVFRSLVYQGMDNFPLGRQDSDTAIRLAPKGWVIPYYIRGNESLITKDLSGASMPIAG